MPARRPRPASDASDGSTARFGQVVDAFRDEPGVRLPEDGRAFGSSALRVDGKIFAMRSSADQFVLKLPAERVAALIASGEGEAYDAGKGRPLREWVAVKPSSGLDWTALAREALRFVRR
jgi:hypothetical protein